VQANRPTTLCEPADEVLPAHHNGDTAGVEQYLKAGLDVPCFRGCPVNVVQKTLY